MIEAKMELTDEEKEILEGKRGDTLRKMLETLVLFGDTFGAKRMVKVTHLEGHLVTSFGIPLLKPLYETMKEINDAGLIAKGGFTADPRPLDYTNVKCSFLERFVFDKFLYGKQKFYEEQLLKAGLRDLNSFSCACYLKECGNTPKEGDILSRAESSAVVYANSVLGARCNRNSALLDLFGSIVGEVPEFSFLTDEGRMADRIVYVKTSKLPEAQILGSAIGMKVMEEVPYVVGLDKFLGDKLDEKSESYLKDFGAASASNGAVGLYHIENLTPEAKRLKEKLIKKDAKVYIIDDAELDRIYEGYPNMRKKKDAKPELIFVGCPHLSVYQLNSRHDSIKEALSKAKKKKVVTRVVMTTPPKVLEAFKKSYPSTYDDLLSYGIKISSICPLMYTNNPLVHGKAIATNSNKLRTYSMARYYKDEDILKLMVGEKVL
jgi:predicted aconitase